MKFKMVGCEINMHFLKIHFYSFFYSSIKFSVFYCFHFGLFNVNLEHLFVSIDKG